MVKRIKQRFIKWLARQIADEIRNSINGDLRINVNTDPEYITKVVSDNIRGRGKLYHIVLDVNN
jgi:ribosomal protein S17E